VSMLDDCDLSQPLLTRVVRGLLTDDLVETVGKAPSTGGRKPVLLGIRVEACRVLGIRPTRGAVEVQIADLSGQGLAHHKKTWSGRQLRVRTITEAIAEASATIDGTAPIVRVGIAVP